MAVIEFWEPNRSEKFCTKYVRTKFTLTMGLISFKWELPAFLGVQLSFISSLHEPEKKDAWEQMPVLPESLGIRLLISIILA